MSHVHCRHLVATMSEPAIPRLRVSRPRKLRRVHGKVWSQKAELGFPRRAGDPNAPDESFDLAPADNIAAVSESIDRLPQIRRLPWWTFPWRACGQAIASPSQGSSILLYVCANLPNTPGTRTSCEGIYLRDAHNRNSPSDKLPAISHADASLPNHLGV